LVILPFSILVKSHNNGFFCVNEFLEASSYVG
jgi:hypothetical protein